MHIKKSLRYLCLIFMIASAVCLGACQKNDAPAQDNKTDTEVTAEAEDESDGTPAVTPAESEQVPDEISTEPEQAPAEETPEPILKDLCADYFSFGVGINGSSLDNQTLNIPEYMELAKKHFNSVTMTNLMKSSYILDRSGSVESLTSGDGSPALIFDNIDPTLKWCAENGMKMRGHTLVWHTQTPEWFFREGYAEDGAYVDKETMLFRMESYISQLLDHVQTEYPGVIYCWDVVNEAVDIESAAPESTFECRTKLNDDPNPWYETIGCDYVEMAFTFARKYADPEVKLFYNDFNTYQAPKTTAICNLCEMLKEKGLIDGIGMQGYWGIDYPADTAIETAIKRFAKLDLEIHITELSIGVDEETDEQFEKQAKKYGRIFYMLHNLDTAAGGPANITNVTVFGLVDHYREGDTTNARLFDKNYQPKPCFDRIVTIMQNNY